MQLNPQQLPAAAFGPSDGTHTHLHRNTWGSYYTSALEQILALRLADNFSIQRSIVIEEGHSQRIVLRASANLPGVLPIVYKGINKPTHWVGVVISESGFIYIDPENNPIPLAITTALFMASRVKLEQRLVKPQSYSNNCGPELIEHLADALTGSRVPEDLVPAYHSELLERFLYAEAGYMTKEVALITPQGLDVDSSLAVRAAAYQPHYLAPEESSVLSSLAQTLHALVNSKAVSAHLKPFVYRSELAQFRAVLYSYNIDMPVTEALSTKGFRAASLALHPDKGGSAEDFAFSRSLQEIWQQDIDLRAIVDSQIQIWQPRLHKATCAFKATDVTVDAVKFYQVPTLSNAKSVVVGSVHLYSMWNGLTKGFIAANGLTVGYTLYADGFYPAMQQASTIALYTVVPAALTAGCPPLGFAYTVGMTVYSGYNTVWSTYEWWKASSTTAYKLESASAYRDNYKLLYDKTGIELFRTKAKEQEVEINSMKCDAEKEFYKSHLEAKDGQFGAKLYEHIYEPYINAKCALTAKAILSELTAQDLDVLLKEELVSIESTEYEVCRLDIDEDSKEDLTADLEQDLNKSSSYYCAHRLTQSIQHVAINGNALEVVEIL